MRPPKKAKNAASFHHHPLVSIGSLPRVARGWFGGVTTSNSASVILGSFFIRAQVYQRYPGGRKPPAVRASAASIRRASGRDGLGSGCWSIQASTASSRSGCTRTMTGVPLPVGAGPLRFCDIKVSCGAIKTLIPRQRPGGKIAASAPGLTRNRRKGPVMLQANAALAPARPARTWPDVAETIAFVHPNGRQAVDAAIAAGMDPDDLYSICTFAEDIPAAALPVLYFQAPGGLVKIHPRVI